MPAYMPSQLTILSDASRNDIRDGMGGGSEGGEFRGEERGGRSRHEAKSETAMEEVEIGEGRPYSWQYREFRRRHRR
jgi:hypothetical protein